MQAKGGNMKNTIRSIIILFFILFFICPISGNPADTSGLSLESSAGYNDNVPKISDKQGSGFALYQINISQSFDFHSLKTSLSALGAYHDYFHVQDNYYLNAGTSLSLPVYGGRIIPSLFSDFLLFRDKYLTQDSKNEIRAGISLQWLVSGPFTLGISYARHRADYREDVQIMSSATYSGSGSQNNADSRFPGKQTMGRQSSARDDRIQHTVFQAVYYFSPTMQTDLLWEHIRVNSSVDTESYQENRISGCLTKNMNDKWEFSLIAGAGHADYESVPGKRDRQDTNWRSGLTASCFIRAVELKFQYEWEYNDSDENGESYHQQVTQCGFIWSF